MKKEAILFHKTKKGHLVPFGEGRNFVPNEEGRPSCATRRKKGILYQLYKGGNLVPYDKGRASSTSRIGEVILYKQNRERHLVPSEEGRDLVPNEEERSFCIT
jgi:hypothetical protein